MTEDHETRTALVITEAGARWPSYTRDIRGRASSAVVESQPPSESLEEFASRAVARVKRLQAREVNVPVAILSVSARVDALATAARYRIARAVLSLMTARGEGELLVVAEEHESEEARHQLVAFAGALCDGLGGCDVNVRVRFVSSAAQSGIRPLGSSSVPPPLEADVESA